MLESFRQTGEKGNKYSFLLMCPNVISLISFLFLISSPFLFFLPAPSHGFNKKEIRYLDMIKGYADNISLQFPIDVYASEDGDIYILDSGIHMILIFNKDLLPISVIDKTNGLNYPITLAVNDKGMVFVSEETPNQKQKGLIKVFDSLGRKKEVIHFEGFPGAESFVARDMAIDENGNLYLAGGQSGLLVVLSKDGKFLMNIQLPIEKIRDGKEQKSDVSRVGLKGDHIYLLSEWQGHVYVYNRKGDKVSVFGKKGGSPGKLSRAQGLAIDPEEGVTYVMDYMRHTLLIYDSTGGFMNEFGGKGWGPGWFNYPKDICIDSQGRLFVADTFNKRVQVFQTRL